MRSASARLRRVAAGVLAAAGLAGLAAGAAAPPRARIEVHGLGWLHNYGLRRTLILLLGSERGAVLKAGAIEDSALMIYSNLAQAGYLHPEVRVTVVEASGRRATFALDPTLSRPLPRPLSARAAIFEIHEGKRYALGRVIFHGLTAVPMNQAESYFRGIGVLAFLTAEQSYSPGRLKRSVGSLLGELERRGYAEATVDVASVQVDRATGRVRVTINVTQGPLWMVTGARLQVASGPAGPALQDKGLGFPRFGPWTTAWEHDAESALRRWYYKIGRPDVQVTVTPEAAPAAAGVRAVTAVARIVPGPVVRLGGVRFVGNTRTRRPILRRLIHSKAGQPLNTVELQDGQFRLSRLGVFSSVDLSYEPPSGSTRDAVYAVQEGKKQDVDLLVGWGSYDELRGGVEWRDYGLFQGANEGYLKVVQSLKGSSGEYDFSVPELYGTSADGTAKLFGFAEHLPAFLDEEYGVNFSATSTLPKLGGADLLAGYTIEHLSAAQDTLEFAGLTHARVASVQAGLTWDRLDNPLEPRHGYKFSVNLVEASRKLGGQVDYQIYQASAAFHHSLTQSTWIHAGLTNAAITTFGGPDNEALPPNVLFYPGGADSIRGYNVGQAAARNAAGQYLGVRTYLLLNVELEQALTSQLSLVLFNDDLGAAPDIAQYPFSYRLYSAGLGLNLRTLVGPIRLEYGRNLNPRPFDPRGTILFSVGFPF